MPQVQKYIERPKVRFSQPPDDSSTNSEKPDEQYNPTITKPRIKSIVILDDPVKIIYNESIDSSKSICNNQTSSNTIDTNAEKSPLRAHNFQNETQKDNCRTVCDPSTIPSGTNSYQASSSADNSRSRFKNSSAVKQKNENNSTQSKIDSILKPGQICGSKIGTKHLISKAIPSTVKKVLKKTTTVSNENVVPPKTPISKINHAREKVLMPCLSRNVSTAKSHFSNLKISKPGARTWKTRSKSSPVKKTILRDVNSHPTNVYVGPGVARYYPQPFKVNIEKEAPHIRPDIVSGEKLSRPEYNSIICTIDELKKVQAEKFVTDVEHLPSVYKNLVNEKVSAALDFPPDEAIYKNLVNLSVNENQLPIRLTRSRDPEPRNRDIVPKLSDFFTPSYSEEYCTAVRIRPSSPEILSNWSAFTISDKIFGWKHDMDQFN